MLNEILELDTTREARMRLLCLTRTKHIRRDSIPSESPEKGVRSYPCHWRMLYPTLRGSQVVSVAVDPVIRKNLRPHQREGVTFMYESVMGMRQHDGQGCILADEMCV